MDTADLDDQLRLVHLKFSGFDPIFIPDRLFYAPGEHDLKISSENVTAQVFDWILKSWKGF